MKNMNRFMLMHSNKDKQPANRKPHVQRALAYAFALLLLLLAGCTQKPQAAPTPTSIALATPTPSSQPTVGGELIIPIPRNPFKTEGTAGANPLNVNTEELRNLYSLIYEPLIRCDATNRLIPSLAEKWSVDESGKVWTLKLRESVLWHADGALLSADDVVYTLNQVKALGADGYYGLAVQAIDSYEKVDDTTVRITMKNAGTASLYSLIFPIMRAGDTSGRVNGTGPYMLKSEGETAVELTANLSWWRQTPYIQTVRGLARASNDVALSSYEAGQLNFVPTNTVSAGKYREEGMTNVLDVMTQDAEVLLFNHNRSLFKSLDMRKAIACAINRGAIVSNVYMNRAAISDVPVPPDSFLYDPTTKIYDYDTTKMEAYLSAAGWTEKDENGIYIKDGKQLKFKLLVNDSTESTYRKNAAAMLALQFEKAGILVEVEAARLDVNAEGDFTKKLNNGEFDIAMLGLNMEKNGNLAPYLTQGGARNYGKYNPSDTLSECLLRAGKAIEEKDMREAQAALQHAFVEELPFVTLYFRMSSVVYSADIHDIVDVRGADILRTVYRWYMNTAAQNTAAQNTAAQ